MNKTLRVAVVVGWLGIASAASAADFGRTPGSFSVSPNGAATYTIPIWTPPGPNGMTPNISVNYSSQSGNGLAGVGWNIGAVSSIERCDRTIHQDGSPAPVDLTTSDRFCFGGNRLRLIGGTYGNHNSTYYTEMADFSRFNAIGTLGNGPSYFIVEGKNGLKYEYGGETTSRVMLGATVLRWMLNKVYDRNGNNYIIVYNNATGFAVPESIFWTPTSLGASTYRYEAKFIYHTTRTDKDSYIGKVAGYDVVNRKRLESIQIKSAGTVIRKYRLTHDTSSVTARSRLISVVECADDAQTNCLLPITFSYQSGQAGVVAGAGTAPAGSSNGLIAGRYDFNGDGKDDIAYISAGACYAALGANNGFSGPYSVGTSTCGTVDRFMPNGRDAIAVTVSGTRWIYRWNDATSAFVGVNTGVAGGETVAADYNGDGLADFVSHSGSQLFVRRNTSSSASSNPTFASTTSLAATLPASAFGGTPTFDPPTSYFGNGLQRADLNGDGRQEIFALVTVYLGIGGATPYSMVLRASGGGYVVPPTSEWTGPQPHFSIKFNSDACTDRVLGSTVYISQCNGIAATTVAAPAFPTLILDWDGDGKSDFLVSSGGGFSVYLSTGTGFASPISTSIGSGSGYYALDQDGDHLEDVISVNGVSAINYWTHTAAGYVPTSYATNIPDLLSNATDGFGVSQSPSYVSTAWSNYDKGAATVLPLKESNARIVVAKLTSSNGIGSTYDKSYYYVGARDNEERQESAGFQRVDETDGRSGLISRTYFEQSFPLTGMVSQQELMQPNGTTAIQRSVFTNTFTALSSAANNQRYFIYPSGSVATEYEYGGTFNAALLRTVTTANTFHFDTGTLYDRYVTTTEPASGANGVNGGGSWMVRTYAPLANIYTDYNNWCIGRPGLVYDQRSHNLTYGTQITRNTYSYWDTVKCRVDTVIHDYDTPSLRIDTALGYDTFGNLTSTSVVGAGMTARTTSAVYSDSTYTTGQFRLLETNALGQSSSTTWDYNLGVPTLTYDLNGLTTAWTYDAFGRRTREARSDGTATSWDYKNCTTISGGCSSSLNKMTVIETALDTGNATINDVWTYLDQFDRSLSTTTRTFGGTYSFVAREYDANGRLYKQTVPCWNGGGCSSAWATTNAYDLVGRLTSVSRPNTDYDPTIVSTNIYYEGLTTRTRDALNKDSYKISTASGLLARSKDHDNYYQQFDYDAFGNPKRVQDSAGNTLQSSVYNLRGVLTQRTDMDMGTWNFTPNALGEITSQTDAKSQTTTFQFDLLGRLTYRTEAEGTSTFTWGTSSASKNVGRLHSMSGPGGYSEAYQYDSFGRPSVTTITADSIDYRIDYGYNTIGAMDSMTYPTSTSSYRLKLKYEYQYGYLARVKDFNAPATVFWQLNGADMGNRIYSETLGNGLVSLHHHDQVNGRLKWIETGLGSGNAIQNLSYGWDKVGNLTSRVDGNQSNLTESFAYDNLHRLDYSQRNGVQNLDMTYDALGNITNKSDVGAYSYHATKRHQLLSAGSYTGFAYDANGNMTTGRGSSVDWTSYNYASCIRSGATCSGTGTNWSSFSYTPTRGYWKQQSNYVSGGEATTIYVGGILEKVTASGVTDYRHMIRAGNVSIVVSRKSSGTSTVNYVTQDHMGSSSVITNAIGGVLINSSFDAFGKRRGSNWTGNPSAADWTAIAGTTRHGYTDHTMLDNVGFIHMNGRVQDPVLGRFASADPTIPSLSTQDFNRYTYVRNNPLSFMDPSGFVPCGYWTSTVTMTVPAGDILTLGSVRNFTPTACPYDERPIEPRHADPGGGGALEAAISKHVKEMKVPKIPSEACSLLEDRFNEMLAEKTAEDRFDELANELGIGTDSFQALLIALAKFPDDALILGVNSNGTSLWQWEVGMYDPSSHPRIDFGAYGSPVLAGEMKRAISGGIKLVGTAGTVADLMLAGFYATRGRLADSAYTLADAYIMGASMKSRNPLAIGGALVFSATGGSKTFARNAELAFLAQLCSGMVTP